MKKATILITDGGGRGHALAYKYAQSEKVGKILLAPGNDLASLGINKEVICFPNVQTTDIQGLLDICKKHEVDLVDVAQDDAVAAGVVNAISKTGIRVFGPTKEAGRIEWDKSWARDFMVKNNLPAPKYETFNNEKNGIDYINLQAEGSWYIKASGLAAGKGAILANSKSEAIAAIKEMTQFGAAGETYLIEQVLQGEEFSAFALVSGNEYRIIDYAQDHKKAYEGDKGPNTGGMGCVAKPLIVTADIERQVNDIFHTTAKYLSEEGTNYTGILYLGGMVDNSGKVWIIEFNARWGDPEAQVILPYLKQDLYDVVSGVIDSNYLPKEIEVSTNYRIVVTVASKGYPKDYTNAKGKEIFGLEKLTKEENLHVFGAGVSKKNNKYFTSGGRLFYVSTEGKDVATARKNAYNALSLIEIEGDNGHYRNDIGWRDLERLERK